MTIQNAPSPWNSAATLAERLATLHVSPQRTGSIVDTERATRRLKQWKDQEPFNQADYFARRLAMDQTTEDELLRLLEQQAQGYEQPWACTLETTFSKHSLSDDFPFSNLWDNKKDLGFLVAIRPLIDMARKRLWIAARKLAAGIDHELPFDPDQVPAMFFPNLERRLQAMLKRTMVLELNVARLEGRLQGETSEERYHSFLNILRDKEEALKLLCEYPVLARQIMVRIEQWLEASTEFLRRLRADWEKIKSEFFPHINLGPLVEVQGGVGDNHRNGRSVLICRFGPDSRLVYKPRSLTLDAHFQDLLRWINDRGSHPPFRLLKIIEGRDYGWVEFVTSSACRSLEEVRRFYERQGGYLALLFALEASDCHHENVVAAGEHPVLIDLEALFHPRLVEGADPAYAAAGASVDYSVLRVGLLPRRVFGDEESEGIDVSGLGGADGQLTPIPVLSVEKERTDEMRFTRKRQPMAGSNNRPSMDGSEVQTHDYEDAIVSGFTAVYETLLRYRQDLLASDGPLTRFANDQVRVLLRPTQTYSVILWEAFHPDALRDALDRDRLLDRLWVAVQDSAYLERVITAERQDLTVGDVPIFTTRPSSCTLWDSRGEQYDQFFQQPGLKMVEQRLLQLDSADMGRQIWFIRASLTSLTLAEAIGRKPSRKMIAPSSAASPDRLLAQAIKIGDRLKDLALENSDSASWVGIGLVNERAWSVLPLGTKLYDGLPGVILFLAYLSFITGRDDYKHLSRLALVTLHRQLDQFSESASLGAYSGLGGIIYVFCHLGVLWGEDELLSDAAKLVNCLPAMIAKDAQLDIIGGSAGCLASLLALYQVMPSDVIRHIALQCGDRLVDTARTMQQGIGWISKGVAEKPLTGFSHGAAGIAWALSELARFTGDDRFSRTAHEAILYERSLFMPEAQNWQDLRHETEASHCGITWCHGAPGIGLARLNMLHDDDGNFQAEIETALQTALDQGFGSNHCLCHGDLGNLELILQASLVLKDQRWIAELNRLSAITLESIEDDGWLCGTPSNIETPGLMTGLAGIGYQLLRLADPSLVPSVLSLSPPMLIKHPSVLASSH
ncbi:MAG TPA: type 2 lanthipeptide synthetase LanM family protein [Candidatus Angelobacter sp.]|nr:type 2 lanthipeptide synthetase LanM family protein [Candidatus Angelobacter sp.]